MYLLLTDTGGHAGWLTLAWEIKHLLLERLTKQLISRDFPSERQST